MPLAGFHPYLERYCFIDYTVVATMVMSQVAGFTVSALVTDRIHQLLVSSASLSWDRCANLQHTW